MSRQLGTIPSHRFHPYVRRVGRSREALGQPLPALPMSLAQNGYLEKQPLKACPICQDQVHNMRIHVESYHLPPFFKPETMCWLCHSQHHALLHLLDHVRRRHAGAEEDALFLQQCKLRAWVRAMRRYVMELQKMLGVGTMKEMMKKFVKEGWHGDHTFQINVVQEVLLSLLDGYRNPLEYLRVNPPEERIGCVNWWSVAKCLATRTAEERERLQGLVFSVDVDREVYSGPVPVADSHCHLRQVRASVGDPLLEISEQFRLAIVIDSRCWISDLRQGEPESSEGEPKVYATVGIHPRVAEQAHWGTINRLAELTEKRYVVGVGECGLDETVSTPMEVQEDIFRRQVQLAYNTGLPLVLHVRAAGDDAESRSSLYKRVRRIVEEETPRGEKTKHHVSGHRFHLHCFLGDIQDYQDWVKAFPNTVFGITYLSTLQESFPTLVRRIDMHRIIVESDSPYLSHVAPGCGKPRDVLYQIREIAGRRNLPESVVAWVTTSNVGSVYRLYQH